MQLLIGKQLLKCEAMAILWAMRLSSTQRESYCTFHFNKNEEDTHYWPSVGKSIRCGRKNGEGIKRRYLLNVPMLLVDVSFQFEKGH